MSGITSRRQQRHPHAGADCDRCRPWGRWSSNCNAWRRI